MHLEKVQREVKLGPTAEGGEEKQSSSVHQDTLCTLSVHLHTFRRNLCLLERNLQLTLGWGRLLFLFFTGKEENMSTLGILDIRRLKQVSVSL